MPLLVNLILGAVLRAAVPYTVAEGGERYRYYLMHQFFPIEDCGAFHCFRLLPPMLASFVPIGTVDAFLVTGFLFQVAAGVMLWLIAEHLYGSRRVALIATCGYWLTWGPLLSFSDPLLITDPVQAFWSFAALYLLLTERYAAALPFLLAGAAVKESVLLVPAIYAVYAWFTAPRTLNRFMWLVATVALPAVAWFALRIWLRQMFGYVPDAEDSAYLSRMQGVTEWLPSFGPAPWNIAIAAAHVYGTFGGAWILAGLAFRSMHREQRALTLASLPAMIFLSLYQSPERALASFPYAVMIPAAHYIRRLPLPLVAAFFLSNAALIVAVRRAATMWWLPRGPVIIGAVGVLIAVVVRVVRLKADTTYDTARYDTARPERAPASRRVARGRLLTVTTIGFAVVVAGWLLWRAKNASGFVEWTPDSRVMVAADDGGGAPGLAVSPDGSRVAFVGLSAAGRELWLRPSDGAAAAERVDGTLNASQPFWSADGQGIGFFADGALKTVRLKPDTTKAVARIADAPAARGGAWGPGGDIVFAPNADGNLFKVAATGGAPTPVTTLDVARGEVGHGWPSFLPDGDRFLFLARGRSAEQTGLHIGSLAGGSVPIVDRALPPAHSVFNAVYAPPGLLFFARSDGVWIQPFDARRQMALAHREWLTQAVAQTHDGRAAFAVGGQTFVFAVPSADGAAASIMMTTRRDGAFVDRRP